MRKLYIVIGCLLIFVIWYQFGRFKETRYMPDYEKIDINYILKKEEISQQEYDLLFYQTGLSKCAIDTYLTAGKDEVIQEMQDDFFAKREMEYEEVFGTIVLENIEFEKEVRSDHFFAVEAGDIIMTNSVHTLGYYHGHIGVVLDNKNVLAATAIGDTSQVVPIEIWAKFSDYVVLRPTFTSKEQEDKLLEILTEELLDVPYNLCVGVKGEKAVSRDQIRNGVHCSYLVWYAFHQIGIELDSDGGKVVTPNDILECDDLKVLQVYGKNPTLLIHRVCGKLIRSKE